MLPHAGITTNKRQSDGLGPSNKGCNKRQSKEKSRDHFGVDPVDIKKNMHKHAYHNAALQMIDAEKKSKDGRLPYGMMAALVSALVAAGIIDATREKLKYAKILVLQSEGSQNSIIGAAPPQIEELTVATDLENVLPKRTGRPKGTTEVEKRAQHEKKAECLKAIVSSYTSAKNDNSDGTTESKGVRVAKGFLSNLINEKKKEFGLSDDAIISQHTVFYRMKNNIQRGPGLQSPLHGLEPTIVEILIQMSDCRQPLTKAEGLAFTNSLIKGTVYETLVSEHQEKYCGATMKRMTRKGEVGNSFWQNFMQRNRHKIVNKRGEKFASSRADWSTYTNFEKMYVQIYNVMKQAGLTNDLDTPVLMDHCGNILHDNNDAVAFGQLVSQKLIHPDHLLFMDEMGLNTNQKKDGHVGGELFLCARGTTPKIGVSTMDHRCTIIPIVAANGDAVCCIIIFMGESSSPLVVWCLGWDVTVVPLKDEAGNVLLEENLGENHYMASGPICHFCGKDIPAMFLYHHQAESQLKFLLKS